MTFPPHMWKNSPLGRDSSRPIHTRSGLATPANLALSLLLLLAACSSGETAPPVPGLPAITGLPACSTDAVRDLSPCDWARSVDAVFVARVERVLIAEGDFVVSQYEAEPFWDYVDCPSGYSYASNVRLELVVEELLAGEAPSTLELHIGGFQAHMYNPSPSWRSTPDEPIWGTWDGNPYLPIVAGQPLGVAAHYVESHGIWSLMGERLFLPAAPADGLVISQAGEGPSCVPTFPPSLEALPFAEMKAILVACPSEPSERAKQRRLGALRSYGPGDDGRNNPLGFMASSCNEGPVDNEQPEPLSDAGVTDFGDVVITPDTGEGS